MKRICKKCGLEKRIDEFVKNKACKFGHAHTCIACSHELGSQHYLNNKEYHTQKNKKWAKENSEKCREYVRKHRDKNRDKINERSRELRKSNIEEHRKKDREYYKNNIEKERLKQKRYRAKNNEKTAEYNKKYKENNREKVKYIKRRYYAANKDKINAQRREYMTKRLADKEYSKKYRLKLGMANHINYSLNGNKNGRSWEKLVGYTVDDLIAHLENQFEPGMSWDNKGDWHIDHKIPVSAFNFTSHKHEDFKRCWALENLRPLWKEENLKKGSKLLEPFQPSLPLEVNHA